MRKIIRSVAFWLAIVTGTICIAFILECRAEPSAKGDSFLDQPFSRELKSEAVPAPSPDAGQQMLPIHSFLHGVTLLAEMSRKKVLLPKELAEWPDERVEKNWGMSMGGVNEKTVRWLFVQLCFEMGMNWHYDAGQHAIILDPKWRREDSRTGKELVSVLDSANPLPQEKLLWGKVNSVGGHDQVLDVWRIAFDALLSKPENFSSAGTLRLYSDTHQSSAPEFSNFPIFNRFAGKLTDSDGKRKLLVLNGGEQMDNKEDPGSLTYYLFNEEGRFMKGGVYAMAPGRGGSILKVEASGEQGVTVDVGWGSFAMNPTHFHFAMVNGDLVFQGSTDSKGMERNAAETLADFEVTHEEVAKLKYSASGVR